LIRKHFDGRQFNGYARLGVVLVVFFHKTPFFRWWVPPRRPKCGWR
jgi:hypothetical protein